MMQTKLQFLYCFHMYCLKSHTKNYYCKRQKRVLIFRRNKGNNRNDSNNRKKNNWSSKYTNCNNTQRNCGNHNNSCDNRHISCNSDKYHERDKNKINTCNYYQNRNRKKHKNGNNKLTADSNVCSN